MQLSIRRNDTLAGIQDYMMISMQCVTIQQLLGCFYGER